MKLKKNQLAKLYSLMVRTRKLDQMMINALKEGRLGGFYHSGQGEEAISIGSITFNLRDDDFIYPTARSHSVGCHIARGVSPKRWVCAHFGKDPGEVEGPTLTEKGISSFGGTVGGVFPTSLGWGVAAKKNGRNQVVLGFFGDGATGRGNLHEAINIASLWKLPIIYMCSNNQFAQFVPIKDAFPRENLADIAYTYNIPGIVVDGQDVLAVHEAVGSAVERARKGEGPSFMEFKTFRMRAHAEGVPDVEYDRPRTEEEKEPWRKRDPIVLFKNHLIGQKILSEKEIDKIDQETDAEIKALDEYQQNRPMYSVDDISALDTWLYSE